MAEVSLKVLVAGRTYPLTVKQEEEKTVLDAADMINEKVKDFEKNYAIRDRQDLIAMAALNLLVTQLNTPRKSPELEKEIDRLVSDKALRREMGKKAKDYVLKNYNIQDNAYLWAEAYSKLYENN